MPSKVNSVAINFNNRRKMTKSNPRAVFFYLLIPVIFIIFIYSFIFSKFSTFNQPYVTYNRRIPDSKLPSTILSDVRDPTNNSSFELIDTARDYLSLDLTPSNTTFWTKTLDDNYRYNRREHPLKVKKSMFIYYCHLFDDTLHICQSEGHYSFHCVIY